MILLDVTASTRHGHFEIHPKDQEAWSAKALFQSMPSCIYQKGRRCYEVSVTDYPFLLKTLRNNGLYEDLVVTPSFQQMYERYSKWLKYFLWLRTKTETEFNVDTAIPLYPHQRVGTEFLIQRRLAILADEMGVGKSATAAAAAWHLIQKGVVRQALIVCPASVKIQWAKDTIEKFLPHATYTIVGSAFVEKNSVVCPRSGSTTTVNEKGVIRERRVPRDHRYEPRKIPCKGCTVSHLCKQNRGDGKSPADIRAQQYLSGTNFVIVNYELLRMDAAPRKKGGHVEQALMQRIGAKFDLVICDEAHRLRNAGTDTFDALWRLAKDSPYRWGLTGTPLQTKLEDAWGVMRFINPAVFGVSRFRFLERYAEKDFWGKIVRYVRVEEVHEKLAPNVIRRRKDDVLDLPPFIYSRHYTDMDAKEKAAYRAIATQQVNGTHFQDEAVIEALNTCLPVTTVIRCRQMAVTPWLIDKSQEFSSGKVKEIIDVLKEITEDHKVVIFCEFAEFLGRFVQEIRGHNINCVYLHGGIPAGKARQELVDRFVKDEACRVFVTTTAGGEGLNLQVADVLILVNLTWNPSLVAQIKGRLHRIGQHRPVNVIEFITNGTIEERVRENGRYRRCIAEQVVDGQELPEEPPMSLDEIMALL